MTRTEINEIEQKWTRSAKPTWFTTAQGKGIKIYCMPVMCFTVC